LKLYDHLVRNDGEDAPPDFYTYLMVRPNCNQRFVALLDSASSGRGFSEIAIYREPAQFGNAHAPTSTPEPGLGSPGRSDILEEGDFETYEHEQTGSEVDEQHDATSEAHMDSFERANSDENPDQDNSEVQVLDSPVDATDNIDENDLSVETADELAHEAAHDDLDLAEDDGFALENGKYHASHHAIFLLLDKFLFLPKHQSPS
jgi:hypothetical protein